MSITVRANQGNTDNQSWGVSTASQKDSAEQIKNRNVVDERSLLIGGSTIDTEMLKADTAAQSKQVNNVENAQTHINKLMKKNNLINEDLKGIEIDLNF